MSLVFQQWKRRSRPLHMRLLIPDGRLLLIGYSGTAKEYDVHTPSKCHMHIIDFCLLKVFGIIPRIPSPFHIHPLPRLVRSTLELRSHAGWANQKLLIQSRAHTTCLGSVVLRDMLRPPYRTARLGVPDQCVTEAPCARCCMARTKSSHCLHQRKLQPATRSTSQALPIAVCASGQ